MTDPSNNVRTENLVVTRILDAPVELVWKAWTDPQHVMRWWGPKYFVSPTCKIDLREGGKFIFCMRAPADMGGQEHYTAGIYKKIRPMESLEFTQGLADQDGNPINPVLVGMPPDFPKEIRTVVTFKQIKGGDMTELTVTEYHLPVGQMFVYSIAGLHQSMDKLAESLK